jgi:hypothetical protein
MTVNERLGYFGLFPAFDAAVRSRKLPAVVEILVQAQFSPEQAKATAESVLASPARYGY